MTLSWLFPFIFQNWKKASQSSEVFRMFGDGGTGKMTVGVKQKQRAVIEFLL
jgi:hypothetical protein